MLLLVVVPLRLAGMSLVRYGKVCGSCGSLALPETFVSGRNRCSKCGGKLDEDQKETSWAFFAHDDRCTL